MRTVTGPDDPRGRCRRRSSVAQLLTSTALLLAAVACRHVEPEPAPEPGWPTDPEGNLVLYVSNQSFAITPVDITVLLDGKTAVDAEFAVENQHNWVKHVFSVPPGTHRIDVRSEKGDAELHQRFRVTDEHWAVLDFWYYPPQFGREMKPQFSFEIQDEPVRFR